jgi:hypothetical protein
VCPKRTRNTVKSQRSWYLLTCCKPLVVVAKAARIITDEIRKSYVDLQAVSWSTESFG